MKHPELVAGVSIASEGSWNTKGIGEINPAACNVPFAISCGQYDREKPSKDSPMNRLQWMETFTKALKEAYFDVESRVIPNIGHKTSADTMAFARACFERARALNYSRTVMIASDFNATNPLWSFTGESKGKTTTAVASE
jgi:hypothetical protein